VRASQRSLRRRLEEAGRTQAGKILVAEDEPHLRYLMAVTLGLEDYEIIQAGTGTDALALAQQHRPDLALLDIRMPELDGIEVCRLLKADPALKGIPVIIVSALAEPADREAAGQVGADHYITKPFSPLELVEAVEELLRGSFRPLVTHQGGRLR
jgi:CheY-like chemotaxis protein